MAMTLWSVDVKGGETLWSGPVLEGRRGVVTGVSLVVPPSDGSVVVEAYVKNASGYNAFTLASLSTERPRKELPCPVLVMGSDFFCSRVMRRGGRPAGGEAVAVRIEGRFNDHRPLREELEVDEDDEEEEDDDGSEAEDEYSMDSEDDDYDSSSEEEEESDGEDDGQAASVDDGVTLRLSMLTLHRRKFAPEGQFLGGSAPRFACAGSRVGVMRVAAVESEGGDDSKQILVLYRYTRFRATPDGVERRGWPKEHQLRFIATGDHAARSLAWAGSSLALLIYPGCLSEKLQKSKQLQEIKQLRELWSSLTSQVSVSVTPGARRIEVFVDVGNLQRADYTPASMEHMYAALESMVTGPWPECLIGMELHLPEPVRCGAEGELADDDDSGRNADERPTKRRRVDVAGEDCPVCWQLMEGDDLAAWPGCGKPHVFHGACLERVLVESVRCPMCRHKLYMEPKLE